MIQLGYAEKKNTVMNDGGDTESWMNVISVSDTEGDELHTATRRESPRGMGMKLILKDNTDIKDIQDTTKDPVMLGGMLVFFHPQVATFHCNSLTNFHSVLIVCLLFKLHCTEQCLECLRRLILFTLFTLYHSL